MTEEEFRKASDCNPSSNPCWQMYSDSNRAQMPTKWVIELAVSLVKLRSATISLNPSDDEIEKLSNSVHMLYDLLNARWRWCVWSPFNFKPYHEKEAEDKSSSHNRGHQLLLQLGLVKKPAPIVRRL